MSAGQYTAFNYSADYVNKKHYNKIDDIGISYLDFIYVCFGQWIGQCFNRDR